MRIGIQVGITPGLQIGAAFGAPASGPVEEPFVIGFMGQSNEIGFSNGTTIRNIDQYFRQQYTPVLLRQQDGTNANPPVWTSYPVEGIKQRTNSPTLNFGMHPSVARYLNRRLPNRWRFSAMGIGSTGIHDHWRNGAAYPTVPPRLFDQHTTWHEQSELLFGGRLRALVMAIGEQDATSAPAAAAHEVELTGWINDERAIFGSDLVIVMILLHINNPGANKLTIRAAQTAVAAALPNVFLINCDDLTLQGDLLHYTNDAYVQMGLRVGAAINTGLGLSNLLADFETEYQGRTINVVDFSTSDGGTVTAWDWDWGDGSPHDTTQNATHTYASDTPRDIKLTVTNNLGVQRTVTKPIRPVQPTWLVDALAKKATAETAADVAAIVAAHGCNPLLASVQHIWPCQSPAGAQPNTVTPGKPLGAGNAPGVQQAFAGFTRLAVGHSGALTNQTYNNNTLLNTNVNATLDHVICRYTTSAAARQLVFRGAADGNASKSVAGAQTLQLRTGASIGTSTQTFTGVAFPKWILRDVDAIGTPIENAIITDREVIRVPPIASAGTELRYTLSSSADATADLQVALGHSYEGPSARVPILDIIAYGRACGWMMRIPGFPDL